MMMNSKGGFYLVEELAFYFSGGTEGQDITDPGQPMTDPKFGPFVRAISVTVLISLTTSQSSEGADGCDVRWKQLLTAGTVWP